MPDNNEQYCNFEAAKQALYAFDGMRQRGLGALHLLTLVAIAKRCNQHLICWLSYQRIADETLQKRRNTINVVARLIQAGYVTVGGDKKRRVNVFRLNFSPISAPHAPCQCTTCTPTVHDMHLDGAQYAPEVILGTSTGEVEQGNTTPNQYTGDGSEGHSFGVPAQAKATTKTATLSTSSGGVQVAEATAKTRPSDSSNPSVGLSLCEMGSTPTPVPPPPSPSAAIPVDTAEGRLAALYLEMLGSPRRHRAAAATTWPIAFRAVLADYPEKDLTSIIRWVWADDFWGDKLDRRQGDPVDYILDADRLDDIAGQWRRATRSKTPSTKFDASKLSEADRLNPNINLDHPIWNRVKFD